MFRRCLSFVTVAVFVCAAPAVSAESVKVVTGNGYKPFADKQLPAGGLATKLVREVYEEAGFETEAVFTSWERGERMVLENKAVAHFPLVKTEARLAKLAFSDPILESPMVPIVRPENAGSITSFEDMRGHTTCLPHGWAFGIPKLDRMLENGAVEAERPDSIQTCYRLLDAERLDFLVVEGPTAPIDAKDILGSADKIHRENFTAQYAKLHVVFDKDASSTPGNLKTFNDALESLRDSGRHQEIVDNYLN